MTVRAMSGGFANAPHQSARAFRAALDAMSCPGRIVSVVGAAPPAPLSQAAGVLILMLADGTTPVHLAGAHDSADIRDWITFQTGAPLAGPADAIFAIGAWSALVPVERFATGTAEYPDRAVTLIVECDRLEADGARLAGPGIAGQARLSLPETAAFQRNRAQFPQGFDCFLTAGGRLAGLPRSTRVEAA